MHALVIEHNDCRGHNAPLEPDSPSCIVLEWLPPASLWFVDYLSGGVVLCSDLSHERGPALAIAVVSNSATTVHEYRILAFAEFKVASFQLEPSEIPFQPLEWPGELKPRGPRQYNDAWHNSTTVLQPVPRKPHNMCHCASVLCCPTTLPGFSWRHREPWLCSEARSSVVGQTGSEGCSMKTTVYSPHAAFDVLK